MQKKASFWSYICLILGLLFVLGIAFWIGWAVIADKNQENVLDNFGKITTGTVLKTSSGYRSKRYAIYEFYVNGKRYEGEHTYSMFEWVNEGDKYEVKYYPDNPNIHRLLLDKPIRNPVKAVPLDSLAFDSLLYKLRNLRLDSLIQKSLQKY